VLQMHKSPFNQFPAFSHIISKIYHYITITLPAHTSALRRDLTPASHKVAQNVICHL
jgi:hypothetical protein